MSSRIIEGTCDRYEWKDGKMVHIKNPGIYCISDCSRCGFFPNEQKRRLETGTWVQDGAIRTLHFRRA